MKTWMKTSPSIRTRAPLLAVLALPFAISARPAQADDAQASKAVDLCVQTRERIFECKDEFAEAFVAHHNPPAAQRAKMKQKALEEIVGDGSGPLEPRRQACSQGGPPPAPEKLAALEQGLARCAATPNCQARVDCLMPVIKDMLGKGKSVQR
jgi:hypothetical protein